MIYDKIKDSEGYKVKMYEKDGHNIPLCVIEDVIENPSSNEYQNDDNRVILWADQDGEDHQIRVVVSACCSAGAFVGRIVTCFKDSSSKV